nr:circularly permuted type 2 ATP-grasp protein [Rhodobacter xinxiangensis]
MMEGGEVRPLWRGFARHLAGLSPDERAQRFARGDQYLRDAGVFFRQYDGAGSDERDWPLSHVPVLVDEGEWDALAAGLAQRADLLEAVMADLYGPARLVTEGHIPASLIAQSPEWLRPMVGVPPRGGHHLHLLAFDVGRGADGGWWVLGDRTQAPSGAGFALENRVATARTFSDFYAEAHVHRLAGFFRSFRGALEGNAAILTPGPLTDTYYEHAYIARYLGLMLLQGEDLAVSGGRLMVRTVSGLKPITTLWRRMDGAWADPLELEAGSRLGTPGMVEALRKGSFTMVNALGSGVLETRALMAFLPRIAKALGQDLILPNVRTWWFGEGRPAEQMVISPALSTRQPFDDPPVTGGDPMMLAGQEPVRLSTTPAFIDGALVPRPMSLRVFLVRTPDGWRTMPGGFARIGRTADTAAIAMQKGGAAADVWVMSAGRVAADTMMPLGAPYVRTMPPVLPTRAADNLFWLGRYVERAEGTMRLLRAWNVRLAEMGDRRAPLLAAMDPLLAGLAPEQGIPGGLIAPSLRAAGQLRDRLSPDGWSALTDLDRTMRSLSQKVAPGDDAARALSTLLRKLTGFSGLVQENMYRFTGWRFLELGRFHERAAGMASVLAVLADPSAPEGALDLAIEVGDSVMAHRARTPVTRRESVIDLLALDGANPRAVMFQLDGIREQVALLPEAERMDPLRRAVLRAHTRLATEVPEALDSAALWDLRDRIWSLSDLLAEGYLR